ncbi:hypothetical protein [Streptomyces sp. NPDC012466]|jgi:hypothetical protein|uniref:hypothetical protein n=1 Tax=Streptomyces sp. NPDC012466 TaxID=3364835 RepID=UPI0036EBD3E5
MSTEHDTITTPVTAGLPCGHLDVEASEHGLLPRRLPAGARRQIPGDQRFTAEAQPSGVLSVFRTWATTIELPDGAHPGPAGHRRIGENLGRLACGEGGPFATGTTGRT